MSMSLHAEQTAVTQRIAANAVHSIVCISHIDLPAIIELYPCLHIQHNADYCQVAVSLM